MQINTKNYNKIYINKLKIVIGKIKKKTIITYIK